MNQIMNLRHYQRDAVVAVRDSLSSGKSPLVVMPTGTGKTVVFAEICRGVVSSGGRVLILAHRRELLAQSADTLTNMGVPGVEIERADARASASARAVVASVQSMSRPDRLARLPHAHFSLVVIDEAHHAPANSYRAVTSHFKGAMVAGFTATPDRLDGVGLGDAFDEVAYEYALSDAIDDGWLVPIVQKTVRVDEIDLSEVRSMAGDLCISDMERVVMTRAAIDGVARPLVDLAGDRQTLLYAASVDHASALCDALNAIRPGMARAVSGRDGDDVRRDVVSAFSAGEFQVLVNCQILTEGYDCPSVSCVAMARPTESRALYMQAVGRGTRIRDGKDDLLVLDFAGNAGRHSLVTAFDILASPDDSAEVISVAKDIAATCGVDVLDALALARQLPPADILRYSVRETRSVRRKPIDWDSLDAAIKARTESYMRSIGL